MSNPNERNSMVDYSSIVQILIEEVKQLNISEELDINTETLEQITLEDLNIDSLETVHLAMSLEERLHIELEIMEFPNSVSLSDLAKLITHIKQSNS